MPYKAILISVGFLLLTNTAYSQSCRGMAQSLGSASYSPGSTDRAFNDCAFVNPDLAEDLRAAQERLRQEQYRREEDIRSQQRFYDWATEPQRPYR
jgi:hypothetical protein